MPQDPVDMAHELYARGLALDRDHATRMVTEDLAGCERALDYMRARAEMRHPGDIATIEEWGHADLGDAA